MIFLQVITCIKFINSLLLEFSAFIFSNVFCARLWIIHIFVFLAKSEIFQLSAIVLFVTLI